MNCAQARLHIGADPRSESPELTAHLTSCPACRRFRDEMLTLEGRIQRALQDPPQLGARRPAPRTLWRPLALAASVLVATVAVLAVWLVQPSRSLAHDVVLHVQEEPESWLARNAVSAQGIAAALRNAGVDFGVTSDRITYAQSCWFHGHYVPHLVVQTTQGPATVLILRHETVRASHAFSEAGLSGVIVPAGTGSIAVLAHGGDMRQLAGELSRDVHWLPEPAQPPPPKS